MTDEVANANLEPHRLPLCDMVMDGGVTSGVIYPKAVVQLSKQFRLKNIGGTSVGALAAAVAAAAEVGRIRDPAGNPAYQRLEKLREQLQGPWFSRPGVTRLFDLFQPQPAMRPLFNIFASALNRKNSALFSYVIRATVHNFGAVFAGVTTSAAGDLVSPGHQRPDKLDSRGAL